MMEGPDREKTGLDSLPMWLVKSLTKASSKDMTRGQIKQNNQHGILVNMVIICIAGVT